MTPTILHGDMLALLPTLPADSIDAVVTDPPYHLTSIVKRFGAPDAAPAQFGTDGAFARASRGFMGKQWDGGDVAFRPETWREVWRVLKPGAHLAAFGGTRTYHRLACAIEDARFEIRDQLGWLYGNGFPKGLNVVNNLIKLALWQSKEHVLLAAQCSASSRVSCDGEREPIAVALAQILPEGGLALLTEIGGEVGLHVPTDTWPSEWETVIGLNTTWSWNGSLDEAYEGVSKSITETMSETTIDRKIWNWLIGLHTSATTTPCSVTLQNGFQWPAVNVATYSTDGDLNTINIQIVTALGNVTYNPVARFKGFNVALKPAIEPIVLARKPLAERTVAANVLKHGCGGLNIDACRVGTDGGTRKDHSSDKCSTDSVGGYLNKVAGTPIEGLGRWPTNLVHDGSPEVLAAFAAFGESKSSKPRERTGSRLRQSGFAMTDGGGGYDDSGTAARFFYSAKAGKADRAGSRHPTVKPIRLIRWLVRMITPPSGTVLDPFAGSGTTGVAALDEGFASILIEREAEYVEDMRRRFTTQE